MPKCGFSNFIEIALQHGYSTNILHIFGTSFYNNTSGGLLLNSKRSERHLFYLSLLNLTPKNRNEIN